MHTCTQESVLHKFEYKVTSQLASYSCACTQLTISQIYMHYNHALQLAICIFRCYPQVIQFAAERLSQLQYFSVHLLWTMWTVSYIIAIATHNLQLNRHMPCITVTQESVINTLSVGSPDNKHILLYCIGYILIKGSRISNNLNQCKVY